MNTAIIRTETRQTITFVNVPTQETRDALRAKGYNYHSGHGVWFKRDTSSVNATEDTLA